MHKLWFFCKKHKVQLDSDESINNDTLTLENDNYYSLIKDIRNGNDLSSRQIEFVNKLQNENLLEIIHIYMNLVKMYKDDL